MPLITFDEFVNENIREETDEEAFDRMTADLKKLCTRYQKKLSPKEIAVLRRWTWGKDKSTSVDLVNKEAFDFINNPQESANIRKLAQKIVSELTGETLIKIFREEHVGENEPWPRSYSLSRNCRLFSGKVTERTVKVDEILAVPALGLPGWTINAQDIFYEELEVVVGK